MEQPERGFWLNVSSVCQKAGMSRQNYYARRRQRRQREIDQELIVQMVQRERRLQPRIGTRKLHWMLHKELAEAGVQIGRDRLFRVLRERKLLLQRRAGAWPRTTNSSHYLPVFSNQIKAKQINGPNQVWVSDLTYLRTVEGYLFLALITDKWSRKVVGYHCGETLESQGCINALDMAVGTLPAGVRPIHHSDRGSQYCCHQYVERLSQRQLTVSMTESNHCAENALAERMNGILKSEYALDVEFSSKELGRQAARQAIHLYNTRRPHTALKYRTPAEVHAELSG